MQTDSPDFCSPNLWQLFLQAVLKRYSRLKQADRGYRKDSFKYSVSRSEVVVPPSKNEMQTVWSSRMAVASMVPNVTLLLLNAVFGHRFERRSLKRGKMWLNGQVDLGALYWKRSLEPSLVRSPWKNISNNDQDFQKSKSICFKTQNIGPLWVIDASLWSYLILVARKMSLNA